MSSVHQMSSCRRSRCAVGSRHSRNINYSPKQATSPVCGSLTGLLAGYMLIVLVSTTQRDASP